MITWDDSMSTGIRRIDTQHKTLIDKFNEFSLAEKNGDARVAAGDILDFLQFYATWHFKHEEQCMDEYQCPIAQSNKNAHAEFLKRFESFYQQWQQGGMDDALAIETYESLAQWIEQHIRRTDAQLRPCVNK
jgi:hemerythrin